MWPEHCNCFCGVTHQWMSSGFKVLFLFWLLKIPLLSSWYEKDVFVRLLADDVWAAEDDTTGFLSVGMDIFDWLRLKERSIPLPMVPMITIKQKDEKRG